MEIDDLNPNNPAYIDDINYCPECGRVIDSNKVYCSKYCAEE